MSLERSARKFNRTAVALTNPQPNYVSMVQAGANMTPWLSIKADGQETQEMHINVARSDDHDIAKIIFKGDKFAKKSAVESWLKEGGYDGFEITEGEGVFEVVGKADLTDTREVETGDGVVITVGKKAVEAAKEEVSPAAEAEAASAVVVAKEEVGTAEVEAPAGAATEEVPAAKEGDGAEASETEQAPGGVVEAPAETVVAEKSEDEQRLELQVALAKKTIQLLATTSIKNADGTVIARKGTYTVSCLGDLLNTLAWMVIDADWMDLEPDTVAQMKNSAGWLMQALASAVDDALEDFALVFDAANGYGGDGTGESAAEAGAEIVAQMGAGEEAPVETAAEEQVQEATEEAPVQKTELELLRETVERLTQKVEEITGQPAGDEQGQSLENDQRQSRRSAEVSEMEQGSQEAQSTASKAVTERRQRAGLGISYLPNR